MKTNQKKSPLPLWGRRILVFLFWLMVWQLAAIKVGQKILLVTPPEAFACLLGLLPTAGFWERIVFSGLRILAGFGLGTICALLLAVGAGGCAWFRLLIRLPLQIVKATPVASFIILALLWVDGKSLSVLISFLMVLPVLYGAAETGLAAVDNNLLEMARVFHMSLWGRMRAVWLPALLPAFRQGCSTALGICWKSGIAAEVIGLPNGSIGDALYRAKITLATPELFAWTVIIVLLSVFFEKVFLSLFRLAENALIGLEVTE